MILSDRDIRGEIERGRLVVRPLHDDTIRGNGIDLRVGSSVCRLLGWAGRYVDAREMNLRGAVECRDLEGEETIVLRPFEHILVSTLEWVEMPDDLVGLINLRSTYARLGVLIPPTVVDAGFKGNIVLEVVVGPLGLRLHPGQRFVHMVLVRTSSPVERPYDGKYQGQTGATVAKPDPE